MIWDKAAPFYDLFENIYNSASNRQMCEAVACHISPGDCVLECACGTGIISAYIAPCCKKLLATDYSVGMLKQAMKKCRRLDNIKFARASILKLPYKGGAFDKVIAANVIHLLDEPHKALRELGRVCRSGGKIIIPTYINGENASAGLAAAALKKAGITFKREFTLQSYKEFFASYGYTQAEFTVTEGRMPCAIAVITKQ